MLNPPLPTDSQHADTLTSQSHGIVDTYDALEKAAEERNDVSNDSNWLLELLDEAQ